MVLDTWGLIALFERLSEPCDCELGRTHDPFGNELVECQANPLPFIGYRWYREIISAEPTMEAHRAHPSVIEAGLLERRRYE